MRRPKAFEVAPARVRVKRGPRKADGAWYWRADRPDGVGGRVDVWTGWASREDAADRVREALADGSASTGELVNVGHLLDAWLHAIREERDADDYTRKAIETAVKRLCASPIGDTRIAECGRTALERHRDHQKRGGYAGATIQRELKYLRQAWRWGQELEPPEIPMRHLPRVRVDVVPVSTRYTPTAEEVGQLLEGSSPAVRRALVLMAATGCRIGEVLGVRWGQVPLDARRLPVDGKTGPRWVELHPAVAAEVRRWDRGAEDEPVVGRSAGWIQQVLARRSAELGIPRCSPNSLRRHVVDVLYETGKVDAAASQLGHGAVTAMSIYRQVREADRRRAVESADLAVVLTLAQPLAQGADKPAREADGE